MIHSIKVNGYKSLNSFSLALQPGLNILVGPNGSGKTNIISFFEFVSGMVSGGLSEAITKSGGAGQVFSKTGENEYQREITALISGCGEGANDSYFFYVYEFTIRANETFDTIYFSRQSIKIGKSKSFNHTFHDDECDLILSSISNGGKDNKYTVHKTNTTAIHSAYREYYRKNRKGRDERHKLIEHILSNNDDPNTSIAVAGYPIFEILGNVIIDLRGGEVFNIIPSRIKAPEDISRTPGIQKDGSGLASTLYAIKTNKRSTSVSVFRGARLGQARFTLVNNPVTLDDIKKYLKTANQSIANIDVMNDPYDNQLKVRFWITSALGSNVLPLSVMSDGTIKWLAIVTAVLTSRSIFSIEEPENFLHPLMQSEVVQLMRDKCSSIKRNTSAIITTHSETLLNSAKPEELIVVSFKEGVTTAKRCMNADDIRKEIADTGFGLGFYYISGSISNE